MAAVAMDDADREEESVQGGKMYSIVKDNAQE